MKKFKLLTISTLLIAAAAFTGCANEEDEKTESTFTEVEIEGSEMTKNDSLVEVTSSLPEEIIIKVTNLKVPSGQTLYLYPYSSDGSDGYEVFFEHDGVTVKNHGAATTSSKATVTNTTAQKYCIEIHDVNKENHIQIWNDDHCEGTVTAEADGGSAPGGTASTKFQYKASSGITVDEIHISAGGGHDH